MLENNLYYFDFSLNNQDSFINFSDQKGVLVINENVNQEPNNLMLAVNQLNNLIITYSTLQNIENSETIQTKIIYEIINLLESNIKQNININYSPFCAYFSVVRYSFNTYKETYKINSLQEKCKLIKNILDAYVNNRLEMYKSYGYTHTILQVMADYATSKRSGNIGLNLLTNIFEQLNFILVNSYEDFINNNHCFIYSDKNHKKVFDEFIKKHSIKFTFRKNRDNKYPDLLLKVKQHFFIIEHKLTNGNGGSQNAEVNEIINFINYSENNKNIHFISCLQGNFMQYLIENNKQFPKNKIQRKNIITALKKNANNYFVNGNGLTELVKAFL